jgi:hypothetical protein
VKYVINDRVVLSRPPKGPLVPYIASFSTWAAGQGYALGSLRQRVRIAADFSRWLAKNRSDCTASHLGIAPRTFDIVRGDSGSAIVMPLR